MKIKNIIILIMFFILLSIQVFSQPFPEGSIKSQTADTVNTWNGKQLGLVWDGSKYWVTCEKQSNPNVTILYTLTTNFSLIDINSNLSSYYISLTYDKETSSIIAAYSNKIVRLLGSTPSSISESSDWFSPITGIVRAISYSGNGKMWIACSDNYLYQVNLSASYSDNTTHYDSSFYFSGSSVTGLAYDGYFLWVFDQSVDLYKEDTIHYSYLTSYNFSGSITSGNGDITFNGDDIIAYGSDGVATFFKISSAPRLVNNLQASDKGNGNTVTVSWNNPGDPTITEYVIKWDTFQTGIYSASNVVSASTYSVDISGLNNFTTYYFIVTGRDADGASMTPNQLYNYYYVTATPTKPATIFNVNKSTGPYYTITNALTSALPGDIIEINDSSTYYEELLINKSHITIRSVENNTPTVTYGGNPVVTINSNNVTLEGLKIILGSTAMAQPVVNIFADKTTIKNCTITANDYLYNYTGINISTFTSNRIENCNIGENLYTAISNGGYDTTIINNEIHDVNTGINMAVNGNIYMNKIYNINTYGINISCMYQIVNIFYNFIYNCGNSGIKSLINYLYIYNNTITKNNFGFELNFSTNSSYSAYLYNNIVYNNSVYDISIDNGTYLNYHYLYNNCYTSLYTNGGSYSKNDNINYDPLFTSPSTYDFSLQSASPCIDAGTYIEYYSYKENFPDVAGKARDIGAFESTPPTTVSLTTDDSTDINIILSGNSLSPGDILQINIGNFDKITSSDKIFVSAEIYSITGRKILVLTNKFINPQDSISLIWDGKDNNKEYVSSGLYILYIKAGNKIKTEKFFWIR